MIIILASKLLSGGRKGGSGMTPAVSFDSAPVCLESRENAAVL
jgi:hypothetical protein